jgi:anti-sigma factor RsiW
MSHLDEGTLHALLDGELDLHEVKEIQAHIGSCAACGTRLREVKEFHGESDRLVGVLEVPAAPSRRTAVSAEAPEAEPDASAPYAVATAERAARRPPRSSGPAAEPPPLLLPENPDYGRGRFIRRMRWAALVLVTVGAGYYANQARQSGGFDMDGFPLPEAVSDSIPGAVVSNEETAAPEEPGSTSASLPVESKKAEAAVPKRVAPRAEAPAAEPSDPAASAGGVIAKTNYQESRDEAEDAEALADQEEEAPPATRESDVRAEAARALRRLDQERQADRADAATAALDSLRRREALARQTAAAAAPAPAPRTPEQRAQIYLRIGLDEAAKQLGGPVHVIEGRSPLFMGLALGRNSPGADAARPVVRVVYQDSQGRLILLDQQRRRPGQATSSPGSDPHWIVGEVSLHLSGEVGAEVLRSLRTRVR